MANVFVTNTARFNPFSYQELATPLIQATQQHMALDEALSSLDDGTLATYLAGEDENSPYVVGYNNLTKRIETLGRQLATEGLNPTMVRDALKLKGDYKRFSTPVETAGKRRQQLSDEYRKLQLTVPYLIGENPSEKSLQFYIDNPNYTPEYDNGEAYINQGTLIGKQLADQLRNPNAPYTAVPGSGGAFIRAVYRRGYTPEEIANDPMFVNITNQIMQSRGVDPSGNDARTNAIRSYIQQGLFSSLGKDEVDMRNNPGYLNALQRAQLNKINQEDNRPEYKSTKYDDFRFVGKENAWANKYFGTDGLVKTGLEGISTADGEKLSNSIQIREYLNSLSSAADAAKAEWQQNANTGGYDRYRKKYLDAYNLYQEEKKKLEPYSLSNSEYMDIKKTLGFENNFTYDDAVKKIENTRDRFGSRDFAGYSLASKADSKDNFDRYIQNLEEHIPDYLNAKGVFYQVDGTTLGQTLTGGQVQEKLKNDNPKRIFTTAPLVWNGGIPYMVIITDKEKIAVPAGLFGDLGDPIVNLSRGTDEYNGIQIRKGLHNTFGTDIIGSGMLSPQLSTEEFNSLELLLNHLLDNYVRTTKEMGKNETESEISHAKAIN